MSTPEAILSYWLEELTPKEWYVPSEGLDEEIAARFAPVWEEVMAGAHGGWAHSAEGALALLILTDQMPRNMFRDTGRAFASDPLARRIAKSAIAQGLPGRISGGARQFFFMPLMHSESAADQARCVGHFLMQIGQMPDAESQLLHARAHREIIRRFGRFPARNEALGRVSSPAERAYLAQGYGAILAQMRGA